MGYVMHDYHCTECGWAGEEMVNAEDRCITCPQCHAILSPRMSAPRLGIFSMASPEQKAEILKKRSLDHTKKEVRKEAEKFKGGAGIQEAMTTYKKTQVGYQGKKKKTKE